MRTNSASDLMNLKNSVLMEFCSINGNAGPKEILENDRRRKRVEKWCDKFIDRMLSADPFKTEEEAINGIAPVLSFLFWWAARQLAIAVVRSLWRRWSER